MISRGRAHRKKKKRTGDPPIKKDWTRHLVMGQRQPTQESGRITDPEGIYTTTEPTRLNRSSRGTAACTSEDMESEGFLHTLNRDLPRLLIVHCTVDHTMAIWPRDQDLINSLAQQVSGERQSEACHTCLRGAKLSSPLHAHVSNVPSHRIAQLSEGQFHSVPRAFAI